MVGTAGACPLSGMAKLYGPEGMPSSSAVKLEPFGDRSEVNETEVPGEYKVGVTQGRVCSCRETGLPLKIKLA